MSSDVKRYDAFDGYGSAMPGKFIRESDYAALEAENARLAADFAEFKQDRRAALAKINEASKLAEKRMSELQAERDAALAQLAAIQQAKGEDVEVVGYAGRYQLELRHLYPQYTGMRIKKEPNERYTDALMTVAQHQRITAAMAAEVERLSDRNESLEQQAEHNYEVARLAAEQTSALRAELEVLTAQRDAAQDSCTGLQAMVNDLTDELAAVNGQEAVAIRYPCRMWDAPECQSRDYAKGYNTALDHVASLNAILPASPDVDRLVKALETARDYVYSELENRRQALAGYPQKWRQEEADLAEIDTALSTWRQGHELDS